MQTNDIKAIRDACDQALRNDARQRMLSPSITLVKTLDEGAQAELRQLSEKARRLAEYVGLKLFGRVNCPGPPVVNEDSQFPWMNNDGVATEFLFLDDDDAIAVTSPRALEILFGRQMLRQVENDYTSYGGPISQIIELALAPAIRLDRYAVSAEFEGTTFHVEYWNHDDTFSGAILDLYDSRYGVPYYQWDDSGPLAAIEGLFVKRRRKT